MELLHKPAISRCHWDSRHRQQNLLPRNKSSHLFQWHKNHKSATEENRDLFDKPILMNHLNSGHKSFRLSMGYKWCHLSLYLAMPRYYLRLRMTTLTRHLDSGHKDYCRLNRYRSYHHWEKSQPKNCLRQKKSI